MKKILFGAIIFILLFGIVKTESSADAAVPDMGSYEAIVSLAGGIDIGDYHIPYGEVIHVFDEYEDEVYFEYGDLYGVSVTREMITPIDSPIESYPKASFKLLSFAETKLFSIPSTYYEVKQTIPAGTELTVTRTSGDMFAYVEGNGYSGWIQRYDFNGFKATVLVPYEKDVYVVSSDIDVIGESLEKTGEFFSPGTKVHTIGYKINADSGEEIIMAEADGKRVLANSYEFVTFGDEEFTLHFTSPDKAEIYKKFSSKTVELDVSYDETVSVFPVLTTDDRSWREYYLYDNKYFIQNSPTYLFDYMDDHGCFIENRGNHRKTIEIKRKTECFDDFKFTKTRGTIEPDTVVDVYYFHDTVLDSVEDERRRIYDEDRCYVEGYGWVKRDVLEENAYVELSEKEEQPATPPEFEPKDEPKEEPKSEPVEASKEEQQSVSKDKENPVRKTFLVCLLFSIIIAGAAVAGIVKIVKSNKKKNK